MLQAHHPTSMTIPAKGNMYFGPIISRSFPSIGAANPPINPEAENMAAVMAALPPNPSLRAGRNTG